MNFQIVFTQLIQNFNEELNLLKIEPISLKIESNTINMHSKLSTNYAIEFNSKLNEVFGFTKKYYEPGDSCVRKSYKYYAN